MQTTISDIDREMVKTWLETPLATMSLVIATLRDFGHDEIADDLTRAKEAWARAGLKLEGCDNG